MAKPASKELWAEAKRLFECGKSLNDINEDTGIDRASISKRAKKESWEKGIKVAVQRGIVKAPNVIYIITAREFVDIYKIGITNDVDFRIKSMQTGCPFELFAIRAFEVSNPLGIESMLHAFFYKKRVRGEWFRLTDVDLKYIDEAMGSVNEVLNGC